MNSTSFTGIPALDAAIDPANIILAGFQDCDLNTHEIREGKLVQISASTVRELPILSAANVVLPKSSAYALKGILDLGALSVWYGSPGSAKTFLILELCFAIASGRHFFGRKTRRGAVFFVSTEGIASAMKRVVAGKKQGHLSNDDPFFLLPCSIDLFDPNGDIQPLIDAIKQASASCGHEPALVVVDTLSRAMGDGDENSRDMQIMANAADQIAQATGAHFLFVHHSGKDASRGGRGHSSLEGAIDTGVAITASDGGVRLATVVKLRDGDAQGLTWSFTLDPVELGIDDEGDPIMSAVVIEAETPEKSKAKLTPQLSNALKYLRNVTIDKGFVLPRTRGFPSSRTLGVRKTDWRDYLIAAGEIDGEASENIIRANLSKLKRSLEAKNLAAENDGKVWLVSPDDCAAVEAQWRPGLDDE